MRHESELAIALNETIAATRLASDQKRLHAAPAADLVRAAAVLSKAMVRAVDATGTMRATRAAALDMIDTAGRAIGAERSCADAANGRVGSPRRRATVNVVLLYMDDIDGCNMGSQHTVLALVRTNGSKPACVP